MDKKQVLKVLENVGAIIIDSHIVYASGLHGKTYINKDAIYPHTAETSRLCRALAEQFANDGVEVVVAPAIGGVILSQWTAFHLSEITGHEVLGVYAEKPKDSNVFVIKRGYDKIIIGKNVLVVEDVLTTGRSAFSVVCAARECRGKVIGVGAICNRGGITVKHLAVPKLHTLANINLETWDEKDCPFCQEGAPINIDVGHGAKFLAQTGLIK